MDTVCKGMPWMSGCIIEKICLGAGNNQLATTYCGYFNLLKDACLEMPMNGCQNFTHMCNNGPSQVKECQAPVIGEPTSMECKPLIQSICNDMPMDGCNDCTAHNYNCNLTLYSNLCLAMPDMSQCDRWNDMCNLVPDWPLCPKYGNYITPKMAMYFHIGISDYVLFKEWVPQDNATYVGTWFAVLLFAFILEFIKYIRMKCENKWNENGGYALINPTAEYVAPDWNVYVDVPRSFLQTLETGWGLLVMLISMTFNVGLFFAILIGTMIGTLVFGRFHHYAPKSSCH